MKLQVRCVFFVELIAAWRYSPWILGRVEKEERRRMVAEGGSEIF